MKPKPNEEQQEELARIEKHIKALYVGYNNLITLLERELKDAIPEEGEEGKKQSSEIRNLQHKTYAQGVGELANVAEDLHQKITTKKKELADLKKEYNGESKKEEDEKFVPKSNLSKNLK